MTGISQTVCYNAARKRLSAYGMSLPDIIRSRVVSFSSPGVPQQHPAN